MEKKTNVGKLRKLFFPAGYYAANSVYQGYISLYYTRLGFSSGQLGWINATTAAATIFAQPLWGMLGDRAASRRRLLALLCIGSAGSLFTALVGRSFAFQLCTATIFYAFFCALLPLGDAILLETGGGFGSYRLAGGLSFALAGFLFGSVYGKIAVGSILWITAGILLLTAAAARLLPASSGKQSQRKQIASELLRDKQLVTMLLFSAILQMTMAIFHTFHPPHFKALGGTDWMLGLGVFFSTLSETPYLLASEKIYHRFGAARPMCVAAAVLSFRWLLLGLAKSPWIALLTQLLHGGGLIVVTVSMAYWINDHVPKAQRAGGQALLNMFTFGFARISGNLLGGWLAQRMGISAAFLAGAIFCAAALAIFAPLVFAKRR